VILDRLKEIKEYNGKKKPRRKNLTLKYSKEEFENLVEKGHTIKEICDILKEDYALVSTALRKFGIQTLKYRKPLLSNKEAITKRYNGIYSDPIAKERRRKRQYASWQRNKHKDLPYKRVYNKRPEVMSIKIFNSIS